MTDPLLSNPSRLHRDLSARIAALIRDGGLEPGTRLAEVALAVQLGVSRTPVRAALVLLAEHGLAVRAGRGFVVGGSDAAPAALAPEPDPDPERLALTIARDRVTGALPDRVTEADLMRRYQVRRPLLHRVLRQLADVAVVARSPGQGWQFLPALEDAAAREESYRWRMLVEPAAILQPGYALPPAWLADMRERHRRMLAEPWRPTASLAFYEMNAAFHDGLAAGAGNRYLLAAVQQQNRLRRLLNYEWGFGSDAARADRVQVSCREHLEILDRIEDSDMDVAAALLRRHIGRSGARRGPVGDG